MSSASLLRWQNDRMLRLHQVDAQCAACLALVPPNAHLTEENLRGYVLLLSAHFLGFCRNLYTEAAQVIASKVRARLQLLVQAQFTAHRKLDHGNHNVENLRADFEHFGFTLDLAGADPANPQRLAHLAALNKWRNVAAHHGTIPAGTPLTLPLLQTWRNSCDGLAASLDDVLYKSYGGFSGDPRGEVGRRRIVMVTKKATVPLKLGDRVQIRHTARMQGRIVELCGPLGPGGAQIYRVRVRRKPKPAYIELREDQLEAIPAKT